MAYIILYRDFYFNFKKLPTSRIYISVSSLITINTYIRIYKDLSSFQKIIPIIKPIIIPKKFQIFKMSIQKFLSKSWLILFLHPILRTSKPNQIFDSIYYDIIWLTDLTHSQYRHDCRNCSSTQFLFEIMEIYLSLSLIEDTRDYRFMIKSIDQIRWTMVHSLSQFRGFTGCLSAVLRQS